MKQSSYPCLIICLLLSSCSLIKEEDISNEEMILLAPADSITTEILTQSFWWEEVEDASGYQIQIVSPGFNSVVQLLVDSTVETNQFAFTLTTGTHQWRVRAVNANSSTGFQTRTLIIDSTSNLSNQTLILVSPTEGTVTNDTSITFRWQKISFADDYRFEIASPDFSSSANILSSFNLGQDSASFILAEGIYEWQVRGQNEISNTLYTTRQLTIDLSGPQKPLLDSPVNNATVQDSATLQWTSSSEKLRDSLFVYLDSLLAPPVVRVGVTENEYGFVGIQGEKYFWRVKTLDRAGNQSDFSLLFRFTVL